SDMLVTDAGAIARFSVQSRALSKRQAVPLGKSIENLRSEWWVVTINANSEQPICFVMSREEVEANASQDKNGGAYWLEPRDYDRDEYRNAWDRMGLSTGA
ncbi:hypothetical protein, partial [Sphingorhabdus sp.]|uniref:hypothetical protein n=1 Tax=Sphingorhabdus sp. TaxID=1902408 RepID=UPI003C70DDDA